MNADTVLLVYANPVYFPAAQPYGLSIVAAALSARGIASEIVLPYMAEDPIQEVRDVCEAIRPRIIGLSLRNLDTARFHYEDDGDQTFLDELVELIDAASNDDSLIVLGGSGFAIASGQILKLTGADVGFIGASESDFAEFCVRVLERLRCEN